MCGRTTAALKPQYSATSQVLTYCAYNNVQRFWNGTVHEFYGLKASQMSKVRASSHDYTHDEKIKNLSWTEFQRHGGPQLSRQNN